MRRYRWTQAWRARWLAHDFEVPNRLSAADRDEAGLWSHRAVAPKDLVAQLVSRALAA